MYNNGTNAIELSFNFQVTNADNLTCTAAGVNMGLSGGNSGEQTYSGSLAPGVSVEIKITSRQNPSNKAATLTINGINIEAAAESSADVTFVYDNSEGTVKVDGAVVAPNGTVRWAPMVQHWLQSRVTPK